MKTGKRKRLTAVVLSFAMSMTMTLSSTWCGVTGMETVARAETATTLSNPTTDSDGVTTWDCIYFGNYWQSDTNGDGNADQNDDNPYYGAEGGNNTTDQVYLLSMAEASGKAYGFDRAFCRDSETREAKTTAYATACGAWTATDEEYEGNGYWWRRSPGGTSSFAAYVSNDGCKTTMGTTSSIVLVPSGPLCI